MPGNLYSQYMKVVFLILLFVPLIKTDIEKRIIPNFYPVCIAVFGFLIMFSTDRKHLESDIKSSVSALLVTAVCLSAVRLFMKDGFGMGDVKLMLSLSWLQGLEVFIVTMEVTALVSFLFVAIMLAAKKLEKDSTLPFVPFAAIGAVASQMLACA